MKNTNVDFAIIVLASIALGLTISECIVTVIGAPNMVSVLIAVVILACVTIAFFIYLFANLTRKEEQE